jgi:hypothetical protein
VVTDQESCLMVGRSIVVGGMAMGLIMGLCDFGDFLADVL